MGERVKKKRRETGVAAVHTHISDVQGGFTVMFPSPPSLLLSSCLLHYNHVHTHTHTLKNCSSAAALNMSVHQLCASSSREARNRPDSSNNTGPRSLSQP